MHKKYKKTYYPHTKHQFTNDQSHTFTTNSAMSFHSHNPQSTLTVKQWRQSILKQGIKHIIAKRPDFNLSNYRNLPCIDLRNICQQSAIKDPNSLTESIQSNWTVSNKCVNELSDWVDSHYWLSMVPCFSEGVFRLAEASYIRWSLDRMDIEHNLLQLTIDYFSTDTIDQPLIQYHLEATITFDLDPKCITIVLDKKKNFGIVSLMKSFDPTTVKQWTTTEISQWRFLMRTFLASNQSTKSQTINSNTHYQKLTENMLVCTAVANAVMAKNRAKELSKPRLNQDTAISVRPDKYQAKMRTFSIGSITVHSYSNLSTPAMWTNVEYRTPSWAVRGHIRNLQSGKTCFVRSHTNHRRKISTTNNSASTVSPNIRIIKRKERGNTK